MRVLWNIETGVPGVRLATKRDEGEIFGLLLLMHAEIGFFKMDRDKVIAAIQWATERKGGIIYVIEEGSRVVATLGMVIAREWYSEDEFLNERWCFVHPDFRKSDYLRKLLEQAKWTHHWFKERGVLMPFCSGVTSLQRTEAKIRLFARHFVLLGGYFGYGMAARQQDAIAEEVRAIEEQTRKSNAAHTREVRPAVETVIRVGKRQEQEESHV